MSIELILGDSLEKLKEIKDNSVSSILTDPPYELGFMGKKWDNTGIAYNVELWKECLRVLKPGGYLLAFGGTRTYHRMAIAIEDAGFEIRDMIEWVYGSGFPKSNNIGKSINKLQENSKWEGWGTNLKPAHEPICMARKQLSEKNIAKNVIRWEVGGINIEKSRIETEHKRNRISIGKNSYGGNSLNHSKTIQTTSRDSNIAGRYPSNLIHDNSKEVIECFPNREGSPLKSIYKNSPRYSGIYNNGIEGGEQKEFGYGDKGNTSRFFKAIIYNSKASKKDKGKNNVHPTVKPTALIEYLAEMITPSNGIVLDPFMGSGTTGVACKKLGFSFIGIEKEENYFNIAEERIAL